MAKAGAVTTIGSSPSNWMNLGANTVRYEAYDAFSVGW